MSIEYYGTPDAVDDNAADADAVGCCSRQASVMRRSFYRSDAVDATVAEAVISGKHIASFALSDSRKCLDGWVSSVAAAQTSASASTAATSCVPHRASLFLSHRLYLCLPLL